MNVWPKLFILFLVIICARLSMVIYHETIYSCCHFLLSHETLVYIYMCVCYYFDWKLFWHNYCTMLHKILMTLECLVSNPLRKQMFHQDYKTTFAVLLSFMFRRDFSSFFILNCRHVSTFRGSAVQSEVSKKFH